MASTAGAQREAREQARVEFVPEDAKGWFLMETTAALNKGDAPSMGGSAGLV